MNRAVNIILGLFLLGSVRVPAQQLVFRHYNVGQGLPSSTVRSILQDDDGFLWFATKNGASRFDGYGFKNYQHIPGDTTSLGNNILHCITRIDSTTLAMGTENGAYQYDLKTGKFSLYRFTQNETVYDVLADSTGSIWFTTRMNGLLHYQPANKSLRHYKANGTPSSISSNLLLKLCLANNKLYIGTNNAGVDVYDLTTRSFTNINTSNSSLTTNLINSLYKGYDGSIWIGTMNGGLCRLNTGTGEIVSYRNGGKNQLKDDIVRAVAQVDADRVYVGTEKGVNVLDLRTGTFTNYISNPSNKYSLSDNAVYCIYPDRFGTIWVGTYFGGVNYFPQSNTGVELFAPGNEGNALSGKAVSCFLQRSATEFWVGTEDGGLQTFNSSTNSFYAYPQAGQQPLAYHNVHSLLRDRITQRLWVGLFSKGVDILDERTGEIEHHSTLPSNHGNTKAVHTFSLFQDAAGDIWVGTDMGLCRWNRTQKNFTPVMPEKFSNTIVYDVVEEGNLFWLATYSYGLIKYDRTTNTFTQLGQDVYARLKVVCLMPYGKEHFLLGSDGHGLLLYSKRDNTIQPAFASAGGIHANAIYAMERDEEQNIWITSINGVYAIDAKTEKITHYTAEDNLQGNQFNYKALYRAPGGQLYAGGINGFNIIDPSRAGSGSGNVKVMLTNFQLFNRDVVPGAAGSPLQAQIGHSTGLELKHHQSVLSIEYAGMAGAASGKLEYAYKLEGFDKQWNYVGRQRKATYTNLSPGTYRFVVKASNNAGNWDVPETALSIKVLPPWYRTTVAYIIYALLALLALYIAYRYSAMYIRRQNALRLERMKNKEAQDFFSRKIEFFTMMAHEVRTPLSLIIAPLEKLLKSTDIRDRERQQLLLMEENSERLMKLVNHLLDFRRLESDMYAINKELVEIMSLVQGLYSRFSALPYNTSIEFKLSTSVNSRLIEADPEVITKIVSNLLSNAFKFARRQVILSVSEVNRNSGSEKALSISVEDDGIGIPPENLPHIFKQFFTSSQGADHYHNVGSSGIGLALASALAQQHGAELKVESKRNQHTIFSLELPLVSGSMEAQTAQAIQPRSFDDRPHVLVVEDDASLRAFISQQLEDDEYNVVVAASAKEALGLLETEQVDMVISDVMMPEMSGVELCGELRGNINYSHLPVILLTARTSSEAEIEGLQSGADAYVTKPFKWKHLSIVIQNLLDTRAKMLKHYRESPDAGEEELTTNVRDREFMEQMLQHIRSRIIDPQLSVEELSRIMAMSRSTLHKKLKTITGMSPNELIRLERLKQAARLLKSGACNISEAAYQTGFSSPSYFTKCFQQQFNLTPTAFAAQQTAKGESGLKNLVEEN